MPAREQCGRHWTKVQYPGGIVSTRVRTTALSVFQASLHRGQNSLEVKLMLTTILVVVLILALVGALPAWGHSRSWGYGPSGALGLVALILIVLLMTGRI
jgi:Protein of unknown function (DUF3309)